MVVGLFLAQAKNVDWILRSSEIGTIDPCVLVLFSATLYGVKVCGNAQGSTGSLPESFRAPTWMVSSS